MSLFRSRPVFCDEFFQTRGAFTELGKGIPLNPRHDAEHHMNSHQWGVESQPASQLLGQRMHGEIFDTRNHQVPVAPYPVDARGFHGGHVGEDRINLTYENMLGDEMSLAPKPAAKFQTKWQKKLAIQKGLYMPQTFGEAKTADDIRIATNEFSDKVNAEDPNCACKYLIMEEMRCLQTYQYEKQPQEATKRCVKWFDEWQKCQWDQHKFNNGYTAIEGPDLMKKRRPYIFYPNFKYA